MIRVTRRRLLLAVLLLFLLGVGSIAWTHLIGLPPVQYFVRYGLDPYCEPTGARVTLEGVEFVEIGPGVFRMGSDHLASGGDWLGRLCAPLGLPWGSPPKPSYEMPRHWVEFRRGFWIATTEITNAQYRRFRPEHDWRWSPGGDHDPIAGMPWHHAKEYCAWLTEQTGRPVRLPSEAEWECACRAGGGEEFTFGDDESLLANYAWFDENSGKRPRAVAGKRPNRWGFFDLHGNVLEWCEDIWHPSYADAPPDGSAWTDGGEYWNSDTPFRVARGGCYYDLATDCRSAKRAGFLEVRRGADVGFRPAFTSPDN